MANAPILDLNGYTDLPPGKIAAVVTYLEMRQRPHLADLPKSDLVLDRIGSDLPRYRALFRRVGAPWLWFSRLVMPDEHLAAILDRPDIEAYALCDASGDIGLLELEFRPAGQCRLAFLGVAPEAIGTGAGRRLMHEAIRRVFSRPVERFFVHTCSLDHPAALPFYIRSGFVPYRRAIEVADDPRLSGHLPPGTAPQIPILAAAQEPGVRRVVRRPPTRAKRPRSE